MLDISLSGAAFGFHTALYGNTSVKVHPARSSPFLLVQYERSEGSPLAGAMRATTLYSVESTWTRDHEAIIRFYGEAPRRRAHSRYGIKAMAVFGSPPPRIVIGSLSAGAETGCL
jgi:hypothetical protein